jgi:hypothetical protein
VLLEQKVATIPKAMKDVFGKMPRRLDWASLRLRCFGKLPWLMIGANACIGAVG